MAETVTRDSVANMRRRCQTYSVEFLKVTLLICIDVKKDEKDAGNKWNRHE